MSSERTLKRPRSVEYVAVDGMCSTSEMLDFLDGLFGADKNAVDCCQRIGSSFVATFATEEHAVQVVKLRRVKIGGKDFFVHKPGEKTSVIRIQGLPREFSADDIRRFLAPYGTALNTKWEQYPGRRIHTGDVLVLAVLKRAIPRFISCDGYECTVFHKNQEVFCYYCREKGHMKVDCPKLTCHFCKGSGHFAKKCPAKLKVKAATDNISEATKVREVMELLEEGLSGSRTSEDGNQGWIEVVSKGTKKMMNGQPKWSEQMDMEENQKKKEAQKEEKQKKQEMEEDRTSDAEEPKQMDIGDQMAEEKEDLNEKELRCQRIVREAKLVADERHKDLEEGRGHVWQLYLKNGKKCGVEFVPDAKLSDVEIVEFLLDNGHPMRQGRSMIGLRIQYIMLWMKKLKVL